MARRGRRSHVRRPLALASLLTAATAVGLVLAQTPLPRLDPAPLPSALFRTPKYRMSPAAVGFCNSPTDCDDRDACTEDLCVVGECTHQPIPRCVPCRPSYECFPTELVFIMDTSGSMKDEAFALCTSIDLALGELETLGVEVTETLLGITQVPGGAFGCLSDTVVNRFGTTVPGDATACPFPDGSAFESWGPATAIVAAYYPWAPDAARIVVPLADEGPCNGSRPDGCNDPGDDRNSITNAINVAFGKGVIVSPIVGTGADFCVRNLASDLAQATFGTVTFTQDAGVDIPEAIVNMVLQLCLANPACDDGDDCTSDDVCTDGRCRGNPIPGCLACETAEDCDDGNACTDDACVRFACSNTPIYDEETFCCGTVTGKVSRIDDENDCTQDLCDSFTGTVDHSLLPPGTTCGEEPTSACDRPDVCDAVGNCIPRAAPVGTPCGQPDETACSEPDTCDGEGTCLPNHRADGTACSDGLFCTEPDGCADGLCVGPKRDCSALDDECVVGRCDEEGDDCRPEFRPANSFCDDGEECTLDDRCNAQGQCSGVDVNGLPCTSHVDCFGKFCDPTRGVCFCAETPSLSLVASDGALPVPDCHVPGEELQVNVLLGFGTSIVAGGQFNISYDPAVLDFLSIAPGSSFDPASPFSQELFRLVKEATGEICYAVGTAVPGSGTQGPAVMATMRFRVLEGCASTDLCLLRDDVCDTTLTDILGEPVPYVRHCTAPLFVQAEGLSLTCPTSVDTTADAGAVTATVFWEPPAAVGGCGRDVTLNCTMVSGAGVDPGDVLPGGGEFPPGHYGFRCTATDACGSFQACTWTVEVSPENTAVIARVQLSPTMAPLPVRRCIEFAFYSSCVEQPVSVQEEVEFGGLFNLIGFGGPVSLRIPPGHYHCASARDPLHTLRAVSSVAVEGTHYTAVFTDDPFFGGNWLTSGNLNGDQVIDILDFGIFVDSYAAHLDPNTPCGTPSPHADLNGDGVVNTLDYSFIVRNFELSDFNTCCPGGVASVAQPLRELSFPQLEGMGLSSLKSADLNGDGLLNVEDIAAFQAGVRPTGLGGDSAP